MRSDWRGVARKAPAPKRSRSKRDAPTAIISIAQHARPNVMGQIEFFRAQLMAKSRLVTMRPSSNRFSIQDMRSRLSVVRDYPIDRWNPQVLAPSALVNGGTLVNNGIYTRRSDRSPNLRRQRKIRRAHAKPAFA